MIGSIQVGLVCCILEDDPAKPRRRTVKGVFIIIIGFSQDNVPVHSGRKAKFNMSEVTRFHHDTTLKKITRLFKLQSFPDQWEI